MKSIRAIALILALLLVAGSVCAQHRVDYSQVPRLRWTGSEPPDTYAQYIAKHPPRPLEISLVRQSPSRTILQDGPPRVLVIANSTLLPLIQTNIDRYIADIEAAGYSADLYSSNHGNAKDLKAFIISQSTDLVGCVFVGALPCAWFEIEDDYGNGYASWPCDLYLMDLDGSWQDVEKTSPMQRGVYDSHIDGPGDTAPEIFIGRIDASQMSGDSEHIQTNAYFDKLHRWYASQVPMTAFALTYTEDDWSYPGCSFFWTDIEAAFPDNEAIIAPNTNKFDYRDNRLPNPQYEFIQLTCHSYPGGHTFNRDGVLNSAQIKAVPPRALFYNLICCSVLRFTYPDFLGGAYIFNESTTALTTIGSTKSGGMLEFWAFYEPIGQGKSMGQAFNEWFNTIAPYSSWTIVWHYGMTIIGDPLVVPYTSDPTNLILLEPDGSEVLVVGEEFLIEWWARSPGLDSLSILLSTDGGEAYPHTIASGLPDTSMSYPWTVSNFPNTLCRIKVLRWYGGVVDSEDSSDFDFIIQSAPYHYASPTGADIYPYVIPQWAAHSVQDAIDASDPGDTVMVAAGTYSENISVSHELHLMGGWDAIFLVRDPELYESRVQPSTGSCVSFIYIGQAACGIEGMTLANGMGTSTPIPVSGIYGGGVLAYVSSPLIKENIFINCGLAEALTVSGGGAIACFKGHAVIENNVIDACKAQAGGGIYLYLATADIISNRITGSYGNVEYMGMKGGGGVYAYHGGFSMENNVISGCYDYSDGGAVWTRFSQASLSGDSLYSNSASNSGGAVSAERDTLMLAGVIIKDNTGGTFGGGIYGKSAYVEIANGIIAGNNAMLGGGIYPDSCSGELVNNTFDRNTANSSGGGMYLAGTGALYIRNNIFSYGSPYGVAATDLTNHVYQYNNCYGNSPDEYSGPEADSTNIYRNPHFADTTLYDYHLLVHSGSIDTGEPDIAYSDPDGSRADQGAFGGPSAVMAALEYVKNASATSLGGATIQITWDEIADPSLAYYVIYGDTSSGFAPDELLMLDTVPAGTESFDHYPVTECWYYYRVSAVSTLGLGGGYSSQASECGILPVGDEPEMPSYVNRLEQNFPNPFNPSTTIEFGLREKGHVSLAIYDVAGHLVRILIDEERDAGAYKASWDGKNNIGSAIASGIYFYRLIVGDFVQTRKMVLLR